jgi:hypothetical protein
MTTEVQNSPAETRRSAFLSGRILPVIMKIRLLPTLSAKAGEGNASQLVPLRLLKYEGAGYVIANDKESRWARALRAVGGGELMGRRGRKSFRAVEIDGPERERVVATYRRQVRRGVKDYFERLPNPADHPTFRIESC